MNSERNERVDAGVKKSANTGKASCWSITINNPTEEDFRQWEGMRGHSWVKEAIGQMEEGESGTRHLQGMLRTQHVRMSQVKRELPRAHIEPAKSETALRRYVQKEDTRVGRVPATRVANQQDLQRVLLDLTLQRFYTFDDGFDLRTVNPEELQQNIESEVLRAWEEAHFRESARYAFAETMLDSAVNHLVRQGFYGVEFVASNPQVRTTFKRYFTSIIIREHARQTLPQETFNEEGNEETIRLHDAS